MIIKCYCKINIEDEGKELIKEFMSKLPDIAITIDIDNLDRSKLKHSIGKMLIYKNIFKRGETEILKLSDRTTLLNRLNETFKTFVEERIEKREASRIVENTAFSIINNINYTEFDEKSKYWIQELNIVV